MCWKIDINHCISLPLLLEKLSHTEQFKNINLEFHILLFTSPCAEGLGRFPCSWLIGLITRSWPVELFSGGSGKNLLPSSFKLFPNQIFYTCRTEVHIFMMAISWESPYLLAMSPGLCIWTGPSQS